MEEEGKGTESSSRNTCRRTVVLDEELTAERAHVRTRRTRTLTPRAGLTGPCAQEGSLCVPDQGSVLPVVLGAGGAEPHPGSGQNLIAGTCQASGHPHGEGGGAATSQQG